MIQIDNLICDFREGNGATLRALSLSSFSLPSGSACAVIGPSGSGKSTLFHCLSGLLRPTKGRIAIDGAEISKMEEEKLSRWRASHVGYIFQQALLLPYLTVMENILLGAELSGKQQGDLVSIAKTWLARMGLSDLAGRLPAHLSGGEKQRVGFVRAILTQPALLLADEPTASLDWENSQRLMEELLVYQKESGCTLLCATHDPMVQALFSQKLYLTKEKA